MLSNINSELLAPAGSFESLQAALNANCDAVYFGIAEFNMRAGGARNFTREDLPEIVERCYNSPSPSLGEGRGEVKRVKTYVTINTVLYNDEIEKMRIIIDAVKEAGVDAVICSDMAAIQYAKENGVEVHISTQLSISNTESLKFYSQYADRVVLARELTLEQIKEIYKDIIEQDIRGPRGDLIELEAFAHGALCVAVSGRCHMSLYCHDKSANRGKCLQMCRREYKVTDVETGREMKVDNNFVMSPADLCTIGLLPEIIDAGISVLKLEGRGRSPDYVDVVVGTYREALNAIEDGNYTKTKVKEWNEKLGTVFNRGFGLGLYRGRKWDEWSDIYGSKATKKKILIGELKRFYPKISVAEIEIYHGVEFKKGEEYMITGNTTGVVRGKFDDMVVEEKKVKSAGQGDELTFKTDKRVRKGDKLYVLRKNL